MLTKRVWKYLEELWEVYEETDADPAAIIESVWTDRCQAARELVLGIEYISNCEDDEAATDELFKTSAQFGVWLLSLTTMRLLLFDGVRAITPETQEVTQELFPDAEFTLQVNIVLIWGSLGKSAYRLVPDLVEILNSRSKPEWYQPLRIAAAMAIGQIGEPTDAAIETLSQVARAANEPQALRAYCIESLMDLGPAAVRSTPILENILRDESEDQDLRTVAWAALKSVTAKSTEHPCGGTIAEHMRSLIGAD